jgi:GPH family glycoside/pentoside/hexuronide:cation symporter
MALSRGRKAGYGVAELGLSGGELLLQLYLLEFYIRGVGLSPLLAGIALALATLWDAVSDPLMGGIVDRTRSRFGRFSPYILAGAIVFGSSLVALFNPPASSSQLLLFGYLLSVYLLVNTGLTLIGVPHIALGGVLSPDTHERTELYGWRLIFATFGLFLGILAPLAGVALSGAEVETAEGLLSSRGTASWLMAVTVLLGAGITLAATTARSRALPVPEETFNWKAFIGSLGHVLRNPVFIPFYAAFILIAMGRSLNATLALPYYKDSLDLEESAIQGPILSTFTLFIVLSVPFWVKMGKRFGKKWPAFSGMAFLGLMTVVAYPLFPPGSVAGPVIAAILGGIAVGAIILVESLVTDIADADYVASREDREGVYFGFWRMGQKVARSVTLGLTGVLLGWIGYEEGLLEQSAATDQALATLFGFAVGGLFLVGSLVFLFTPMTRARQLAVQQAKATLMKEQIHE